MSFSELPPIEQRAEVVRRYINLFRQARAYHERYLDVEAITRTFLDDLAPFGDINLAMLASLITRLDANPTNLKAPLVCGPISYYPYDGYRVEIDGTTRVHLQQSQAIAFLVLMENSRKVVSSTTIALRCGTPGDYVSAYVHLVISRLRKSIGDYRLDPSAHKGQYRYKYLQGIKNHGYKIDPQA